MKLRVGAKLGLGFGVVILLTIVTGLLSYLKVKDAQRFEEYVLTSRVPTIERSKDLQNNLNFVASKTRQTILAGSQANRREDAKKLCDAAWDRVEKDLIDLEQLSPGWRLQENRDRLARIRQEIPKYKQVSRDAIALAGSCSPDAVVKAGNEYSDKAIVINDAIKQSLGDLVDSQVKLLNEERQQIASANAPLFLTISITTFAAIALGAIVAVYLSRKISTATSSVLRQAEAIARGDLTEDEVNVVSENELGDLTRAINKMHGNYARSSNPFPTMHRIWRTLARSFRR